MEPFKKVTCTHCGAINFGEQTRCLECSNLLPVQEPVHEPVDENPQLMVTGPLPEEPQFRKEESAVSEWQLRVVGGEGIGQVYPLGVRTTIGRTRDNDIQLKDPKISRKHAVVEQTMEGCMVTDLGSANGTYVSGKRIIRRTLLEPGAEVQLGDTILMVEKKG